MVLALIASLYDMIQSFHGVPNGDAVGFAEGDDLDLPIFLD
jgi:hypothetical protein